MANMHSKWWLLLVTATGTSLTFLDITIIPVALPTIEREFGFSDGSIVWVVNAYLLSLTSLLLVGGRLCDLLGKRKMYLWGFSLFGTGSLLCAFSFSVGSLLLGRAIQGVGGALIIPTSGALLISRFPMGERAKVLGINTAISSIFLIMGPPMGGFFTQFISWRSIFFINLPLVAFGIIMTLVIVAPNRRKRERFHFGGAFILMAGISSLVIALMQANSWGWSSPWTLTLLLLSPLFFILFFWRSTHFEHPLIDFHFFHNRLFSVANLCIFLVQMVLSVTVMWAIYFQEELHYSPIQTGLIIFVAVFPVFLMAPLGGYLGDRLGPRRPILCGFFLLTFALFWLVFTAHAESIVWLLPGLLSFGSSVSLIMSPAIAMALSVIPTEKLGAASGITIEARQLAATSGIALMTSIFYTVLHTTHSPIKSFEAISFLAGSVAVVGFLTVFMKLDN